METFRDILIWMGLFGLPTVTGLVVWCVKFCKNQGNKLNILMKAVQAQMRSNLLAQYHYHMDNGFITDDDMEDWENQYQSYHNLGNNGVMDSRRKDLMKLPNHK